MNALVSRIAKQDMKSKKCTVRHFWRGYKAWLAGRHSLDLKAALSEIDLQKANRRLQEGVLGVSLVFVLAFSLVKLAERGHPALGIAGLVAMAVAGLAWAAYIGGRRFKRFASEMCELGRQLEADVSP